MFFLTRRRERPFAGFFAAIVRLLLRRRRLAPAGNAHALRALAPARVGLGPLASDREPAPVAQAAVGADFHQPLDVLRSLAAQVALDLARFDRLAQPDDLVLGQVLNGRIRVDLRLGQDAARGGGADTEDVGEADLGPLVHGDVDSGD